MLKFMFTDAKEFGAFVAKSKCATKYGEMYSGSGIYFVTTNPSLFDINSETVIELAAKFNGKIVE